LTMPVGMARKTFPFPMASGSSISPHAAPNSSPAPRSELDASLAILDGEPEHGRRVERYRHFDRTRRNGALHGDFPCLKSLVAMRGRASAARHTCWVGLRD
jgi:hypothetical protein